jgi:hypothetical protein
LQQEPADVDGDIAIAHTRTDPTLPHETQLVLPHTRVRDDKAAPSEFAGRHREEAAGPHREEAAGPVRPDDAADRRAGDRLSLSKAHHL